MASDLERRIERLEEAAQLRTRPLIVVFDAGDESEAQAAAYRANTPEAEQAELIVVITDPMRDVRQAVPVIAPQAGSVAELLDKDSVEELTKRAACIPDRTSEAAG